MGLKSADALEEQNQMMELCERSASSLSQAMEATTTIQNKLSDTVEDADKAITELADNENVSAETKEELAKAAERAQGAMETLVRAQAEADAAMEADNQTINRENSVSGKTIGVTGKVEPYTRDKMDSLIAALGAVAGSSVTRKTDYLVCGEKAGSKLSKARELDIPVLTPEEFFRMAGVA